jgi:hypothetical protein
VEPYEQGLHPATGRFDLLLPLDLPDRAQFRDHVRQAKRGRNRRGKVGGPWPGLRLVTDLAPSGHHRACRLTFRTIGRR